MCIFLGTRLTQNWKFIFLKWILNCSVPKMYCFVFKTWMDALSQTFAGKPGEGWMDRMLLPISLSVSAPLALGARSFFTGIGSRGVLQRFSSGAAGGLAGALVSTHWIPGAFFSQATH